MKTEETHKNRVDELRGFLLGDGFFEDEERKKIFLCKFKEFLSTISSPDDVETIDEKIFTESEERKTFVSNDALYSETMLCICERKREIARELIAKGTGSQEDLISLIGCGLFDEDDDFKLASIYVKECDSLKKMFISLKELEKHSFSQEKINSIVEEFILCKMDLILANYEKDQFKRFVREYYKKIDSALLSAIALKIVVSEEEQNDVIAAVPFCLEAINKIVK